MPNHITLPPDEQVSVPGDRTAGWWVPLEDGAVQCELCPRGCRIAPGKRGFCFVRQNLEGRLVSTTYGRSTGFCIDPIEKKPLNQFYPGTPVLSFGTAGCNLRCLFCQNWTSSRSREVAGHSDEALPEAVAEAALAHGCKSVAFTYNDPIIWAEYAIDTAKECHARGVKTVAVTNGYIRKGAREEFFSHMDAANIDLKAFTERFYRDLTDSSLKPVLETLEYVANETDVWIELTNLIVPGENDDAGEIARMCDWVVKHLGPDVPMHFTAFHPDFKMLDRGSTPIETLIEAYEIAKNAGVRYPYTGNVHDPRRQSTYCPDCKAEVIRRAGYQPVAVAFKAGLCTICGYEIAGRFDDSVGDWGSRREPVRIARFSGAPRRKRPASSPDPEPNEGASEMATNNPSADSPAQVMIAQPPKLTEEQESAVFDAAARWLTEATYGLRPSDLGALLGKAAAMPVIGAFVTAKRKGRLRSCCGFVGRPAPLGHAVAQAAIRTATDDPRFPPLSSSELDRLDLDVWLLFGMKPVEAQGEDRVEKVEVGRHGLQISRGERSGLLLPGVATELELDSRGFLEQVCLKAGLPRDAWLDDDTALYTFEGKEIRAPFEPAKWIDPANVSLPRISQRDITTLSRFARQNLAALMQGATPSYYLSGVYDGEVLGMTVTVFAPQGGARLELSRLALKPPMPLQATLFDLVQTAANTLARQRITPEAFARLQVAVSVLSDAAVHGSAEEPDLEGIDPATRAVGLVGAHGWAWSFNREGDPESLLAEASAAYGEHAKDANVVSLDVVSTETSMTVSNVPKPTGARPPAVAGTFYPARRGEIEESLANMIPPKAKKEPFAAALIPHAGWAYSGALAAKVLSRIAFPSSTVIFCPRHRPGGSRWAVCPYDSWAVPGGTLASDPELAKTLVAGIDHLESDPVAHRGEHAIEVALPMIERLAPKTKVVGIAMSGGSWEELEHFAEQFAEILRPMEERPLLIVSSDMNHFADDTQTRRLDRLALDALEARDPKRLFETVTENRISMCGFHAACIVLETLRRLGTLNESETVGYSTSADTTGDTSRVVGYAGMLFR